MAAVLTGRNLLLVVLFVWSVRQLFLMGRNPASIPRHDAQSAGNQLRENGATLRDDRD